ncbi:MAG: response regulator transcription factor [Ferruginibacter sp.]|nr:response regulator transcription factor [Ferruginibacter sp.]
MAKLALVDDHVLLRNGLSVLVKNLGHEVLLEASNGQEFIEKLKPGLLPQIVLMDINMPEMDGYDCTKWLKKKYPDVKVLALSMYDNEVSIIRMLQSGAKGYILKDSDPAELEVAIDALVNKGFYYSELVSGKMINAINKMEETEAVLGIKLNDREICFLKHTCTELSYRDIADKMLVSPRTVDGYRDALFQKLRVKSRVGLVVYAIRNGIVDLQ